MNNDEKMMKEAVKAAKKAKGKTGVNPLVGCVIERDGRIISKGYHKGPGYNHAEIEAINSASEPLEGSTIYITLEPCNIFGRTPPCIKTLEMIKFRRIVIGMKDPNPKVNGRSIAYLKKKGYEVEEGVCSEEVSALNPHFRSFIESGKTYIIMKIAQTADGCISERKGCRSGITCQKSLKAVHEERYNADAILIGSNTINIDDPILDARLTGKKYKPSLIILDFSNRIDFSKQVMKDEGRKKYIFISRKFEKRVKHRKDIEYIFINKKKDAWRIIKEDFHKRNIISVLVEGGNSVFSDGFESGHIDEIMMFIAPKVFGEGCVHGLSAKMKNGRKMELTLMKQYGEDAMLRFRCSQD